MHLQRRLLRQFHQPLHVLCNGDLHGAGGYAHLSWLLGVRGRQVQHHRSSHSRQRLPELRGGHLFHCLRGQCGGGLPGVHRRQIFLGHRIHRRVLFVPGGCLFYSAGGSAKHDMRAVLRRQLFLGAGSGLVDRLRALPTGVLRLRLGRHRSCRRVHQLPGGKNHAQGYARDARFGLCELHSWLLFYRHRFIRQWHVPGVPGGNFFNADCCHFVSDMRKLRRRNVQRS